MAAAGFPGLTASQLTGARARPANRRRGNNHQRRVPVDGDANDWTLSFERAYNSLSRVSSLASL